MMFLSSRTDFLIYHEKFFLSTTFFKLLKFFFQANYFQKRDVNLPPKF